MAERQDLLALAANIVSAHVSNNDIAVDQLPGLIQHVLNALATVPLMVEWVRWSGLPLFVLTAICTHLVVSSSQTLFHYGLGHHRIGGIFYRNHIRFHHAYYARGHLVSATYRGDEGNNTPYFLIPTVLVASGMFLVLPLDLFVVTITASVVSFSAHVYLDKQYHTDGSILARFAWFRHKQQLHFVHHLHGDSNFAVIDFFWDRVLGTFRGPDTDAR